MRQTTVWCILTHLMDIAHYFDGQAHTCLQQATNSVGNIEISRTLCVLLYADVNHIVSQLSEHYTSLGVISFSFFSAMYSCRVIFFFCY